MRVSRLTESGLNQFQSELLQILHRERRTLSRELLMPGEWVEEVTRFNWAPPQLTSRWSVATEVDDLIGSAKLESYAFDAGFWAWLTVLLFDQVCPAAPDGSRPDLRTATSLLRYYPQLSEWRRYYRHLVAGPWMIYQAHRDNPSRALVLLAGPVTSPGEAVEQIASRQELVTSATVMEVAKQLYFNSATGKLKRGASRKLRGGARRFADVLQQFDVTFDLYSLRPAELLALLPAEFDEFKQKE